MTSETLRKPKGKGSGSATGGTGNATPFSEVKNTTEFSEKSVNSERECALRVTVDDATILKPEGFRRVTESLRGHAIALGQVGGWRGCPRAADAWVTVFQSLLGSTEGKK